jgi:hypothetical protein
VSASPFRKSKHLSDFDRFANTAGHTKKTCTTGMLLAGLCVGNMVGPQLYLSKDAPYYKTGLTANLVVLCVMAGLIVVQAFYLKFLNHRNDKKRTASGRTKNVDYSLESSANWAKIKAQHKHLEAERGFVEETNENAFADLTDLKNEDFVYSL